MHAHGIEVLDGAHHHDVVAAVAHELELVFLPSEDGLLEEDLVSGARLQSHARDAQEVGLVVGHAGAGPSHGEGRAHHDGVAQRLDSGQALLDAVADGRPRALGTDIGDDPPEELAILAALDGVDVRADELHAVALERAGAMQGHGGVERGLSAERGEEGVGPLALDDALDVRRGDRLDVRRVGELRIGHDRRGIRVDEDDPDALGLEHATGLGARVVELARLADDDRPGADDQHGGDVVATGHQRTASPSPEAPSISRANSSKRSAASCGPAAASGWYWTLKAGTSRQRRPSTTPSLRHT